MAEYYPVVTGKQIAYTGYFDIAKLWKLIRDFSDQRGYSVYEKHHHEVVRENGKDIRIKGDIDRSLTEYQNIAIGFSFDCTGVTDVVIERNGKKHSINEGKVTISFDAFVKTDKKGMFEGNGKWFFYRTLMEKLTQHRQLQKTKALIEQDLLALIKEIKSYLNLYAL